MKQWWCLKFSTAVTEAKNTKHEIRWLTFVTRHCSCTTSTVEPRYNVPVCNSFPVTTFGFAGPVRTFIDGVLLHSCLCSRSSASRYYAAFGAPRLHRKWVEHSSRKRGMISRVSLLRFYHRRVSIRMCSEGRHNLGPRACARLFDWAVLTRPFALASSYGCRQPLVLCKPTKPSVWWLEDIAIRFVSHGALSLLGACPLRLAIIIGLLFCACQTDWFGR